MNYQKNKVSIILPYYKKKKFFDQCIKSAINQSYKNKEIIIIYDDDDKQELEYIKKKIVSHKYIKLIINDKNLGASKSRNIGIKKSKGEYIAFLDCDDYWLNKKLEEQIKFMKKKNIKFSYTGYHIINNKNSLIGKMPVKKKISYKDLLKSCDIGLSTVVLKKNILPQDPFPPLITKEDYVLWLRLSKKNEINGLNKFFVKWRKLENSLSSNITQKIKDAFKVYYIYEKKDILVSIFLTLRLSCYAAYKKFLVQKVF